MQRACGVVSGSLSPQIKAGSLLRARWNAPCTQLGAIPTGGRVGASTSRRLAGVPAPRTRRRAIRCSESLSAGRASRARQPFRSVVRRVAKISLDYGGSTPGPWPWTCPNLTPLPPWTKRFASSRIAAITSFVPCPKAYEGGTWDIAKNKSALQGVVPAEPSPATFRRILSPESIQATAPPDRVPAGGAFPPEVACRRGGGMMPSWDAIVVSKRRPTSSRPRRSETVLHRE